MILSYNTVTLRIIFKKPWNQKTTWFYGLKLLLMKRGGQVTYAGPLGYHSERLVEYFQGVPGVPRITEGYNPATWVLEVSSISMEMRLGVDFSEVYKKSSLYECNQAIIKELSTPAPGSEDLNFPSQYAQSFIVQCIACLWKQHRSYWRNPHYIVVRFFFTIVVALIFGTIFWKLGMKRDREQDLLNVVGSMYCAVLFLGISNSSSVQPVVEVERTVFYREKAAGMYSAIPYAFGQMVIEVPYVLLQAIIYAVMVYYMISFEWTSAKFFWFLFFMFFTFLYFTYFGMMSVAITPSYHIASIISSAFYSSWNLFCGFIVPQPKIPVWWRWFYWINPISWTLYGLIAAQFGDVDSEMDTIKGKSKVVDFVRSYFGIRDNFLGVVAPVMVCIPLLFALMFAFSIKTFNFQKR